MSTEVVTAQKLLYGGEAFALSEGKVVFVPGLLPGEVAEIETVQEKKDYNAAVPLKILKPSAYRVQPFCPHYGECGGCNMQHIDYTYQLQLKRDMLQDIFEKAKVSLPVIETVSGSPCNYRCRMQFHNGGLKAKASEKIIPIDQCPIATEEINRWLQTTDCAHRPQGKIQVFGDRRITAGHFFQPDAKVLVALPQQEDKGLKIVGKTKKQIKNKVKNRHSGTVQSPQTNCTLSLAVHHNKEVLHKDITFDIRGFFQSNLEVLEKTMTVLTKELTELLARYQPGKEKFNHALDIYSGAGTLSVFLAPFCNKITLVEHNRDALVYAHTNLQGVHQESYGLSGATWATTVGKSLLEKEPVDLAIIDPPRSGIEKELLAFLSVTPIPFIFYVSCNPTTQARDCSTLEKQGYRIKKFFFLDFYPHTSHIETLALLEHL